MATFPVFRLQITEKLPCRDTKWVYSYGHSTRPRWHVW